MTGQLGKYTNAPADIVGAQAQEEVNSQWGNMKGRIVSFDGASQTATIKPLFKPVFNGKEVEMPELLEVPVRFQKGGKGALTFPVEAGNIVSLRPQMRSSENLLTGEGETASDARSFNLSDMEATLDNGDNLEDALENFDNENMHLRFNQDGTFGMKASADGKISIDGGEGNIYDLLATAIELIASDQLQINYGSSAGSGHELQHKAALTEIAGKLRAMAL